MVEKREQGASGDEELWCWLTTAMVERRGRLRRIAWGKPYGCGYRARRPVGLLRDSLVRADGAGSPKAPRVDIALPSFGGLRSSANAL